MNQEIYECRVNFLSLKRALSLTPPEFKIAWDWFLQPENHKLTGLPFRNCLDEDLGITLVRQSGIHSPSYSALASRGANKTKYVLTIHTGNEEYSDKEIIDLKDGTWILDYCAHRSSGKDDGNRYNETMMNNLRDGIPVAVLTKERNGYTNHGLAYVEQYNAITDSFILHGPATYENADQFSFVDITTMTEEEKSHIEQWGLEDERTYHLVKQVRRKNQASFRNKLLEAYEETCAISETDVVETLQAAHIDPYRGKKSQTVRNGILLRSDFHLIYDAHLLDIAPVTRKVTLSNKIKNSVYSKYHGTTICIPKNGAYQPDDNLLEIHHKQFLIENSA